MKLREKIKWILTTFPKTRNSDSELIAEYIYFYHKDKLIFHNAMPYIALSDFKDVGIGKDTIRRERQLLQSLYPELRADENIIKGRKIKEKEFRSEYGGNSAYNKIIL